jgi:hypothetical protein
MRYWFLFLSILFHLHCFSQDSAIKQISFLLDDLRQNFKLSLGAVTDERSSHKIYSSNITIENTGKNEINLSNKNSWVFYTATISDSTSFKEAKRLLTYWRNIVQRTAIGYAEKKLSPKAKVAGSPLMGYFYEKKDGLQKFWVSITYTKGAFKYYYVMLDIGRQNW